VEAVNMTKNTSIVLGDHFTNFIDLQLEQGRYGSTSEVVRAGLRMLEEHEAKVNVLRSALIEGEESGEAEPFEVKEFLSKVKSKSTGKNKKRNA
jgi:antitoxin ParD1/3/4